MSSFVLPIGKGCFGKLRNQVAAAIAPSRFAAARPAVAPYLSVRSVVSSLLVLGRRRFSRSADRRAADPTRGAVSIGHR